MACIGEVASCIDNIIPYVWYILSMLHASYKSATREYSLAYCSGRTPVKIMGVALSKLQIAIVACICTLPVHLQQAKSLFQKLGMAHEANVAAEAVIVLPYCVFLISRLTRSNIDQTWVISKLGLTRTKCDPVSTLVGTKYQAIL